MMHDDAMMDLFRQEAEAQSQVLNEGLLTLERSPRDAAALEACMRAAHSLKGAARIVGLDAGVTVAHVMEDCLVSAQDGRLVLAPEHIDALLYGTDLLLHITDPAVSGGQGRHDIDNFVTRLTRLLSGEAPSAEAIFTDPVSDDPFSPQALARAAAADDAEAEARLLAAALAINSPAPSASPSPAPTSSLTPTTATAPAPATTTTAAPAAENVERVLRVTAEHLNRLLDLSSKSLVELRQVRPMADSLQRLRRSQGQAVKALENVQEQLKAAGVDAVTQALLAEVRQQLAETQTTLAQHISTLDNFGWQAGKRTRQIYDTALICRMRPFADVTMGQARMVRDLGRSLGKQVRLEIEGDSTQVDREVLKKLEAPLTHLLRNAVDHGIELPAVRTAAGKPAEGLITLRAYHHADMLRIELSDDGAGVDLPRLRRTVVERQLTNAETAERLSEAELLAFLFLPGFSLREAVTELSGRGVGLDAVHHDVRQLRGSVQMTQVSGAGSRFFLEMPLTLSIVRSLLVEISGEAYALPLAHIERMRDVPKGDIVQLEGQQHFWYEGAAVGLVAGSQLLQGPEVALTGDTIAVVVVRERDTVFGIAVDRLLGEQTLVVLSLDPRLGKIQDIAAGALLDNGAPVLILDVEDLLRSVEKLVSSGRLNRIDRGAAQDGQAARKRVLVVDDSLTVRELERKLLLNRGYDVSVAVDGMDGWNMLRSEHFDLVVTDIDMPRMDGIELVTLIRRDSRLQALPVMVVSYKDREEDRRRGLDAGADYYLAKASFHDEALLDAVADLIGAARG